MSIPYAQSVSAPNLTPFSGFFRHSVSGRLAILKSALPTLDEADLAALSNSLPLERADRMVENCLGLAQLPLGIAPTFVVNGRHRVVPMATEEPSVIAAASATAKLIAENGGFQSQHTKPLMPGQIQLCGLTEESRVRAKQLIESRSADFLVAANEFCPSMVKRGGGAVKLAVTIPAPRLRRRNSSFAAAVSGSDSVNLIVTILVDCCESMGANIVNTVCEGLSASILALLSSGAEQFSSTRVGLRILSNLCSDRRSRSEFRIPLDALGWKGVSGSEVASRVIESYEFACDDEYRACTNNKGIMNGIDAVAVATGQDWRAIEAAAHCWAWKQNEGEDGRGFYGPLAHYRVADGFLIGSLELPISVGTVGGSVNSHPLYRTALKLLGSPSTGELSEIIVSVGLAQNFAAIRALAVEGIQRGHMALHSKNIVSAVGTPLELIDKIADYCVHINRINQAAAEGILKEFKKFQFQPIAIACWLFAGGQTEFIGFQSTNPRLLVFSGEKRNAAINKRIDDKIIESKGDEPFAVRIRRIMEEEQGKQANAKEFADSDADADAGFAISISTRDELFKEIQTR